MLMRNDPKPQNVEFHALPNPEYDLPLCPGSLQKIFADCADLQCRRVKTGGDGPEVWVLWLEGLVSGDSAAQQVLRPLTDPARLSGVKAAKLSEAIETAVYACDLTRASAVDEAVAELLNACCVVLSDGVALCFQLRSDNFRSVESPETEKTVKGAKDAFTEPLRVNTALVRAKLRTPKLKLRQTVVGRKSRTRCSILWVEGVCPPELPQELFRRLDGLQTDGLLQPAELEAALSDSPNSPLPQLLHTERPDRFAAELLRGRAGVLCDGLPTGFLAPATLPSLLSSPDDDAQHFIIASCMRLLRWGALLLSVTFPAFLVAVAMYHQEMIPTKLLLSMIEAKQDVPFSVATEILCMLISFELLQEAGLRLPDPVGQSVSIIGALIVGQSAVDARVVSPVAVIVVAVAGVAGYTIPNQDLSGALRLSRFLLVLATLLGGMFGLMAGAVLGLWHMCSLESFGTAYLSPLSSAAPGAGRRALIRQPAATDSLRDPSVNGGDLRRRQ